MDKFGPAAAIAFVLFLVVVATSTGIDVLKSKFTLLQDSKWECTSIKPATKLDESTECINYHKIGEK